MASDGEVSWINAPYAPKRTETICGCCFRFDLPICDEDLWKLRRVVGDEILRIGRID
jgi:hypothetical protein